MSSQQWWKCGIVDFLDEARWSVIKQNYNKHSDLLINLGGLSNQA